MVCSVSAESHSGPEELLEHFSQPCLGLGHLTLLQGLQYSALALRGPLLRLTEVSASSQKSFLERAH